MGGVGIGGQRVRSVRHATSAMPVTESDSCAQFDQPYASGLFGGYVSAGSIGSAGRWLRLRIIASNALAVPTPMCGSESGGTASSGSIVMITGYLHARCR